MFLELSQGFRRSPGEVILLFAVILAFIMVPTVYRVSRRRAPTVFSALTLGSSIARVASSSWNIVSRLRLLSGGSTIDATCGYRSMCGREMRIIGRFARNSSISVEAGRVWLTPESDMSRVIA